MNPSFPARFLAPCLAAFWLFAAGLAVATPQPSPAPLAAPQAGEPGNASPEAPIARLRQRLADANEQLAAMASREAHSSSEVATPAEVADAQMMLGQMARIYQRQIDSLSQLQSLAESRAEVEKEAADWTGLQTPPPYSFLVVDGLREAARFQQTRLDALKAMGDDLDEEFSRRKDALEEAAGKLRQANEQLEGKQATDPRLAWLRDFALLRQRLAEARVEGIQVEKQAASEEAAEARQRLEFVKRQLQEASSKLAFPPEDQAQVLERLESERRRLQTELDAALPQAEAARQARDATAQEAQQKGQADDPARLAELEDALEIRREQAENAILKVQVLNRLLDMVKSREQVWKLRWAKAPAQDAEAARQAYTQITKLRQGLQPMKAYLQQRLKLASAQSSDMEKQLLDPASARLGGQQRQLRELYAQRVQTYQSGLGGIDLAEHLLDLWKQDLDDRHQAEPWAGRRAEWLAQLREAAAAAWAFELFAVEDTIEVDGQPVTGKRSVTLGKVATALLILVAGLWLSSRLVHAVERLLVRRGRLDAGSARIARRWVMFAVGAALVMVSLVMVKIPLTVFAFAGGALAIGTGFGMQNLLKNLISGLMLLWERPFKPGDLVEVGGVRGRVVDIGVRSSHIRDSSGIETVIPNSTFVEENVTNWTLSNRSVRIAVKLGVAYGTNVHDLMDLLQQTADRHGLVQKDPAPQVLFEDFGADALQFGLYVWVELKPGVDWTLVASDLRHMIYKTLAANGIVMAFPQRDVHLDTAQPLQVRVLGGAD